MFAKPRVKKSVLPLQSKKRKATYGVEEVNFDIEARQEFLTGFHKRKQQRIKNAQEEAAKRARLERIEARKQVREERRREVEDHVNAVNRMLQESEVAGGVEQDSDEASADEWDGIPDQPDLNIVDHEEEYIDEDRYTTVTVESVSVSRDGLYKPQVDAYNEDKDKDKETEEAKKADSKPERPKKKKKKFRYESKIERQLTEVKRKIKSRPRARA